MDELSPRSRACLSYKSFRSGCICNGRRPSPWVSATRIGRAMYMPRTQRCAGRFHIHTQTSHWMTFLNQGSCGRLSWCCTKWIYVLLSGFVRVVRDIGVYVVFCIFAVFRTTLGFLWTPIIFSITNREVKNPNQWDEQEPEENKCRHWFYRYFFIELASTTACHSAGGIWDTQPTSKPSPNTPTHK